MCFFNTDIVFPRQTVIIDNTLQAEYSNPIRYGIAGRVCLLTIGLLNAN